MSDGIWWITMRFPVTSEAFAGVEVRALRARGADLRIFTLRTAPVDGAALLAQWRLAELAIDSQRPIRTIRAALRFAARNPLRCSATLFWLVRHGYRAPMLLLRCLAFVPRMVEIFAAAERERPRVVHLFWGHYPAVLGYMLMRWMPRTVLSISLGAYDLVYGFGPSVWVANRADCLWTHATYNLAALCRLGIDVGRCEVLIRGVDLAQVPQDCLPKSGAKIVSVGRLIPGKGMRRVVEAFAAVAADFPEAELVIVGDGPERQRLESLARQRGLAGRVAFLGNVAHDRVYAELRQASIFMLLSSWKSERIPNVVKEAMACGCLCIVSDCPGIMEIMSCMRQPLIVPGADSREAAALLRRVLEDEDEFADDRRMAVEFCRSSLDSVKVADRRLRAWANAAQRKAAAIP